MVRVMRAPAGVVVVAMVVLAQGCAWHRLESPGVERHELTRASVSGIR
jgi:hypothetical protein